MTDKGSGEGEDIFCISGPINRGLSKLFANEWRRSQRAKTCNIILTTLGGDAAAAYKTVRFVKRHYEYFRLYVSSFCKSAGTLVALAADEIVMGEHGELGPLDVQITKEDEIARRNSGLDVAESIHLIADVGFRTWESGFLQIINRSSGTVTTRTAADIASDLAGHLIRPLVSQVDPVRISEVHRAIRIAEEYGLRMGADPKLVVDLITRYPDHAFVIDVQEAAGLFPNAREMDEHEYGLVSGFQGACQDQFGSDIVTVPAGESRVVCFTPSAATREDVDEDTRTERRPVAGTPGKSGGQAADEDPGEDRLSHDRADRRPREGDELQAPGTTRRDVQ